jgi:hypothetical protein
MKLHKLILIILILGLMLVACTNGTETIEEPRPEEPGEYPGPEAPVGADPYPASDSVPAEAPDVLYPGVEDGGEVNWNKAIAMIMNGEVVKVVQTHDLKVSLTLRDGRTLITYQQVIDDVLQVIEACGEPCAEIIVATE